MANASPFARPINLACNVAESYCKVGVRLESSIGSSAFSKAARDVAIPLRSREPQIRIGSSILSTLPSCYRTFRKGGSSLCQDEHSPSVRLASNGCPQTDFTPQRAKSRKLPLLVCGLLERHHHLRHLMHHLSSGCVPGGGSGLDAAAPPLPKAPLPNASTSACISGS